MRLHRAFTALVALAALAACEKNAVQDITGTVPTARIRFFNFAVAAPTVHFYADAEKLSASSTTACQTAKNPPVTRTDSLCLTTGIESTTGIGYGGVTAGGSYIGVDPGQYTFSGRMTAAADKGTTVSSASTSVADGKFYSYYQTGIYNATTKTADAFILEDNMPPGYDWSTAYVRFVNASPNAQPMTLHLTNIATGETLTVGDAIAFKNGSAFVKVPIGGYDLVTRYTGSSTNRITRTNVGFEAGGIYTITARGDMTVTSTTAVTRPFLDFSSNR